MHSHPGCVRGLRAGQRIPVQPVPGPTDDTARNRAPPAVWRAGVGRVGRSAVLRVRRVGGRGRPGEDAAVCGQHCARDPADQRSAGRPEAAQRPAADEHSRQRRREPEPPHRPRGLHDVHHEQAAYPPDGQQHHRPVVERVGGARQQEQRPVRLPGVYAQRDVLRGARPGRQPVHRERHGPLAPDELAGVPRDRGRRLCQPVGHRPLHAHGLRELRDNQGRLQAGRSHDLLPVHTRCQRDGIIYSEPDAHVAHHPRRAVLQDQERPERGARREPGRGRLDRDRRCHPHGAREHHGIRDRGCICGAAIRVQRPAVRQWRVARG